MLKPKSFGPMGSSRSIGGCGLEETLESFRVKKLVGTFFWTLVTLLSMIGNQTHVHIFLYKKAFLQFLWATKLRYLKKKKKLETEHFVFYVLEKVKRAKKWIISEKKNFHNEIQIFQTNNLSQPSSCWSLMPSL